MTINPRNDLYVGVEVVCVDDKVPLATGGTVKDAQITEGQVYRIRWIGMAHLYTVGDYLGVKLEGIDSKFGEANGVPDAPFNANRFRPLVRDPIALFKRIATDPSWKVAGPEGPCRDTPLPERKRERETVE